MSGKLCKSNDKRGFTLAEVLMVIFILGVIACETIPALVLNITDKQLKVAWKKEFSTLSQATLMMMANNGGTMKGAFVNVETMQNAYLEYLKSLKVCVWDANGNCWHADGNATYLDGVSRAWTNTPASILNGGSLIRFNYNTSNCTASGGFESIIQNKCGGITVDVNGFKKPNVIGKDIFLIYVVENGIKPYGIDGDIFDETCVSGVEMVSAGTGCAAKVLKNEDY